MRTGIVLLAALLLGLSIVASGCGDSDGGAGDAAARAAILQLLLD